MGLPKNAITLELAREWVSNWRNKKAVSTEQIIAHLVPCQDVLELMKERGWVNFRAYQGITNGGEFKLMIVGVDAQGNDLVDYSSTGGDFIYDMTTPCPSVCSLNEWWL